MPEYEFITYESLDEGSIVRITLNRPEARNAQTRGMLVELDDAFASAQADDAVRVVILCGAGPMFSSGHDTGSQLYQDESRTGSRPHPTSAVNGGSRDGVERLMLQEWHYFFQNTRRWRDLRKITIAQVHGSVFAAGLMLMWACDLIVAGTDTRFVDVVGTRLGMCGVEYFAHPWELGPRKAKELLLTGDSIDAEEGYRLGFVSKIFEVEELPDQTLAFARRIAGLPTMTALLIKDSVNQSVDNMGFQNALSACFNLHQLNHAHWSARHESGWPCAEPQDGVPHWRDAPPLRAATKNSA
jgi:enoyl-CoA hydratase